jgi:hypothetical protein
MVVHVSLSPDLIHASRNAAVAVQVLLFKERNGSMLWMKHQCVAVAVAVEVEGEEERNIIARVLL